MSKFDKSGAAKSFEEAQRNSAQKSESLSIRYFHVDDLIPDPDNNEDVSYTSDLEQSMDEIGFTDPLEVTDFGMPVGKYRILSGHRRHAAAKKKGIENLPCVVRHFDSEQDVRNYSLMSNSQRDSSKDPLLFASRYKMHEDYLLASGYADRSKTELRAEIAKRLGISVQSAERYRVMNEIISPVWDMIREEKVGISSVQAMAQVSKDRQKEIYKIMLEANAQGVDLTREVMKNIISQYKAGAKTWADVEKASRPAISPEAVASVVANLDNNLDDDDEVAPTPAFGSAATIKTDEEREAWMQQFAPKTPAPRRDDDDEDYAPASDFPPVTPSAPVTPSVPVEATPYSTPAPSTPTEKHPTANSETPNIPARPLVSAEVFEKIAELGKAFSTPCIVRSKEEGSKLIDAMYSMIISAMRQMETISKDFELGDQMAELCKAIADEAR